MKITIAIVVALLSLLHPLDLLVRKEYRVRPDLKDPLVQVIRVLLVQLVRSDRLATLDQLVPDPLDLKAFKVIQDRLDR